MVRAHIHTGASWEPTPMAQDHYARLVYLIGRAGLQYRTHPKQLFRTHMVDMVKKYSSNTKYTTYRTGMFAHVVL
jgi:hypothetical protein